MSEIKARPGDGSSLPPMSDQPPISRSARRHPWPRFLVQARRVWFGMTETAAFLGAALAAVARFLIGRWPEPSGRDYLAPRGRDANRSTL